jgi:hypothetical protein
MTSMLSEGPQIGRLVFSAAPPLLHACEQIRNAVLILIRPLTHSMGLALYDKATREALSVFIIGEI